MATPPAVGDPAPDFELPSSAGGTIRLASLRGEPAVLYFYPKADTPGCTTQACGVRDAAGDFREIGASVLGISPDAAGEVKKFADKFDLNFPLLADADHATCEAYGVWRQKQMYGKSYWGAARTTFVLDAGGKVTHVFEKVKPDEHARQVLAALRGA